MPAADIPMSAGSAAATLVDGRPQPVGVLDLHSAGRNLLVTSRGGAKAFTSESLPSRGDLRDVIRLDKGERLVAAFADHPSGEADIAVVASSGKTIRFRSGSVPSRGLAAGPVAGHRLEAGAEVVAAGIVPPGDKVLCGMIMESGRVKLLDLADVPTKGRGGGGVMSVAMRKGDSKVVSAIVGASPAMIAARGAVVRSGIEVAGRSSSAKEPPKPVVSLGLIL